MQPLYCYVPKAYRHDALTIPQTINDKQAKKKNPRSFIKASEVAPAKDSLTLCTGILEVVGATGFEPATSASRTQRSTKLSHAPSYLLTNKSMSVTNNNLSQFFIKIKCILFFHEALLLLHCYLPDCTHCLDFPAGLVLRK